MSRALGPRMCERGWGRIINLGSILSVVALPGRAPYAASKAGVVNLTRVLALEWASRGVTVNAICPGPFGTEMNRQLLNDPEKYKAFVEKIPMGRWGELHEIAGAAVLPGLGRRVVRHRVGAVRGRRVDGSMKVSLESAHFRKCDQISRSDPDEETMLRRVADSLPHPRRARPGRTGRVEPA